MSTMPKNAVKIIICFIYVGFFAFNCSLIVYAWTKYYLINDGMIELMKHLGFAYGPPGGLILAGLFKAYKEDSNNVPIGIAAISLFVVMIWNVLITWPFIYLVWTAGPGGSNIGWVAEFWRASTDTIGFITAIPLTFLFLKGELKNVNQQ
jgi:hypothetical protein